MSEKDSVALPTNDRKLADTNAKNNWVCPEFKVSGAFTSHMVLQRGEPIIVWGFSTNIGGVVKGEFMGEGVLTHVAEDGRWSLRFLPHSCVYDPQIMKIYDDIGHEVVLEDILVGDVWLIGGQSNAELNLSRCMYLTPSVDFYHGDNFRLFRQTQAYVFEHQEYCNFPQLDIINPEWCWKRPDEEASLEFSAIGYYFGREMIKKTDVPLGLVMMCAGGACIRELLPEEIAHSIGYFYGANVRESGYYNALINPFVGMPFKGMMFFQGESEGGDRTLAERYDLELALLFADERKRFGREFPIYNVQLTDYKDEGKQVFPYHDIVRVKQFDAQRTIHNYTLTSTLDLGAPDDYEDWPHSPRKLEVAERLARLILAREYGAGRESEQSCPRASRAVLSEDRKSISVEFENVESGLCAQGHNPVDSLGELVEGFSVGDYDHRILTTAKITSRCHVTVDVPENATDEQLTHVNYAYFLRVTMDNATLRGGNNLPALAFSIEVK